MIRPSVEQKWLASLKDDPAVRELARGVDLAEGFDFYLLLAATPMVARAVRAQLEAIGLVQLLDPYEGWDLRRDMPVEALLRRVQDRIGEASGKTLLLDGTRQLPEERAAWLELFRRLNERRNELRAQHRASFLLVLPPDLERDFADEAPDLWSVRSAVLRIEAVHEPLRFEPLGAPWPLAERITWRSWGTWQPDTVERYMKRQDWPDAFHTSPWLPEGIEPLFLDAYTRGEMQRARQLCERAVLASRCANLTPSPWYRYAPLQWQGIVAWEHGDRAVALSASIEALALEREAHIEDEGNIYPRLSLYLQHGDVHHAWGEARQAHRWYLQALRRIKGCNGPHWWHERISVLVRLFALARRLPALEEAHGRLLRALDGAETQQFLTLDKFRRENRRLGFYDAFRDPRELALAVLRVRGDYQLARGDFARALVHYDEMAALCWQGEPERPPRRPIHRYLILARYLAAAACLQAQALLGLDRPGAAIARLGEAITLFRHLSATRPLHPPHIEAIAQLHLLRGLIHEDQGETRAAYLHLKAAEARLRSIFPAAADSALYRERSRQCLAALRRL